MPSIAHHRISDPYLPVGEPPMRSTVRAVSTHAISGVPPTPAAYRHGNGSPRTIAMRRDATRYLRGGSPISRSATVTVNVPTNQAAEAMVVGYYKRDAAHRTPTN